MSRPADPAAREPVPAEPVPPEVILAARAADAKGGIDTLVLAVGDVLAITGHFVITSAGNTRQVRTIAEEIEQVVADAVGRRPLRTEGMDDRRWVLLDYGDFVVHTFLSEARSYYELERLWSDVPRVHWQETGGHREATGGGQPSIW